MCTIDYNKHIWEGWKVIDFINAVEPFAEALVANSKDFNIPVTKKDIRECCIDYQPYYKKYIPEVVEHFCNKYNIVN